jgi:MFS family permease
VIAAGDATLLLVSHLVPAIGACTAVAGFGIGLSSVAATSLGTDVEEPERATASGIVNTAAQLGTAIGVSVVLLVAAATTGLPGPDADPPTAGWAVAAALAAVGALAFAALGRTRNAHEPV